MVLTFFCQAEELVVNKKPNILNRPVAGGGSSGAPAAASAAVAEVDLKKITVSCFFIFVYYFMNFM